MGHYAHGRLRLRNRQGDHRRLHPHARPALLADEFSWVPTGARKGWQFNISVKAAALQDLKYDKHRLLSRQHRLGRIGKADRTHTRAPAPRGRESARTRKKPFNNTNEKNNHHPTHHHDIGCDSMSAGRLLGREPAPDDAGNALRRTAIRQNQNGTLRTRLRRSPGRSTGRHRGDSPKSRTSHVRQHHRRTGAQRKPSQLRRHHLFRPPERRNFR